MNDNKIAVFFYIIILSVFQSCSPELDDKAVIDSLDVETNDIYLKLAISPGTKELVANAKLYYMDSSGAVIRLGYADYIYLTDDISLVQGQVYNVLSEPGYAFSTNGELNEQKLILSRPGFTQGTVDFKVSKAVDISTSSPRLTEQNNDVDINYTDEDVRKVTFKADIYCDLDNGRQIMFDLPSRIINSPNSTVSFLELIVEMNVRDGTSYQWGDFTNMPCYGPMSLKFDYNYEFESTGFKSAELYVSSTERLGLFYIR
jgi:hypothetical protein